MLNIPSLKYQRFTASGCKDKGNFKNWSLYQKVNFFGINRPTLKEFIAIKTKKQLKLVFPYNQSYTKNKLKQNKKIGTLISAKVA